MQALWPCTYLAMYVGVHMEAREILKFPYKFPYISFYEMLLWHFLSIAQMWP